MQTSHEVMWICLTCVSKGSDTKIDIALQLYMFSRTPCMFHEYVYMFSRSAYICYIFCYIVVLYG